MRILTFTAAALTAYMAHAAQSITFRVPLAPPARYNHEHPALTVVELALAEVDRRCRALGGRAPANETIKGCSVVGNGRKSCWIIIPSRTSVPERIYKAIYVHERAHCNGWAVSHPRK